MITLNMIVRDEAHCIERCLNSVLPFISSAVIVDTGSKDDTKEVICRTLGDLPLLLLDHEWVDFGYNRTKAFWGAVDKYPEGYALVIDADEEFLPGPDFQAPLLDRCGYAIWQTQGTCRFLQPRFLSLSEPWVYQGSMHEVAECLGTNKSRGVVDNCTITGHFDSARNKQGLKEKCKRDAEVMETMPETPRNVFYKAQCYRDAGELRHALDLYWQRVSMGGFQEEVYLSLLISAQILQLLGARPSSVASAYEVAYRYRPSRAEAPYYLAEFLSKTGHPAAEMVRQLAASIPMTIDQQGVNTSCYAVK